jgi:hypothetical protein
VNATETARISRAIAGLKPAQHFDDETPAYWALVLAGIRYEDARQAVINLAGRVRFIDPSDIVTEVKRLRDARLCGVDRLAHLAETPAEWRQIITKVADGELVVPAPAFEDAEGMRRIDAAVRHLLQRPPAPLSRDYVAPKAIEPPRDLAPSDADRVEAERARQLAEIEARIDAENAATTEAS